jgi:hypothetical protein
MRAAWMLQRAARTCGDSTIAFLQPQQRGWDRPFVFAA